MRENQCKGKRKKRKREVRKMSSSMKKSGHGGLWQGLWQGTEGRQR